MTNNLNHILLTLGANSEIQKAMIEVLRISIIYGAEFCASNVEMANLEGRNGDICIEREVKPQEASWCAPMLLPQFLRIDTVVS